MINDFDLHNGVALLLVIIFFQLFRYSLAKKEEESVKTSNPGVEKADAVADIIDGLLLIIQYYLVYFFAICLHTYGWWAQLIAAVGAVEMIIKVVFYRVISDLREGVYSPKSERYKVSSDPAHFLFRQLIDHIARGYLEVAYAFTILHLCLIPSDVSLQQCITFYSINNSSGNIFLDMFYYSVVTLTTLGYGDVSPVQVFPKLLASIEVLFGLLSFGVVTGLVVSTFSALPEVSEKTITNQPIVVINGKPFRYQDLEKQKLPLSKMAIEKIKNKKEKMECLE